MKKISLQNLNILILGGAGFIGHNLALHLKKLGAKISIIDSLNVNHLGSMKQNLDSLPNKELLKDILYERLRLLENSKIPIYVQDVREYHKVSKYFSEIKPKVVIHLAAVSHANRSNKDPHSTFDHSLRTLENALDSAKETIEHFIFLSSSMVYGNFKSDKVDEKTHCEPLGIYGALKYAAEKIIISYNQVFDLPYTIVRPSALYGERCISRRVGQIFIENALQNKEIEIHGDGSEKLDFTYIKDLIDGITKVIENPSSKNEIFNLTFGQGRPIFDLLNILKENFPSTAIKKIPRDKLMPKRGTLSIEKARSLINYNPNWPIDKAYPKYIKWYLDFFKNKYSMNKQS
jgi:nucleoside-diphosphate-sugar epimerase